MGVKSPVSGDIVYFTRRHAVEFLCVCAFCLLLVLRSSSRRGVETASSKYKQVRDFERKRRTPETVEWSTDLHAGRTQVSMSARLIHIEVEAEVDFPNCKHIYKNTRGEKLCTTVGVFETIQIVDFLLTLTRTTRKEDFIRTTVQMEILRSRMSWFVRTRRRTVKYIHCLINRF